MRTNRHGRTNMGVLLLMAEVGRVGLENIPPVTLAFLAANVAVFLGLLDVPLLTLDLDQACVSAVHVWMAGDMRRLFLSVFYHVDDLHLYYNMVSFLWKGRALERKLGSVHFLCMLAAFCALTNFIYVGVALGAWHLLGDVYYIRQCAVGFSGVIFALKVVAGSETPFVGQVYGVRVPVQWVAWIELVVIAVMVPGSSFLGHLAGILAGLLYVYGPLKPVLWALSSIVPGARSGAQQRSYTREARSTGYASSADTRTRFQRYTGGLNEDEQYEEALRRSRTEISDSYFTNGPRATSTRAEPSAPALSADEIRRRRLERLAS